MVKGIVIFTLSLFYLQAHAQTAISCLPEATSLQSYESGGQGDVVKTYELSTLRLGQLRATGVNVQLKQSRKDQSLELSFSFQQDDIMSLPFNIYAVLVVTEKGETTWRDLTSACTDPGIGFYPGQKVKLDPIPLKIDESESYRVMIWGQK